MKLLLFHLKRLGRDVKSDSKKTIESWRQFDNETLQEIEQLNSEELENAFYTSLNFGTGGLRGLMGIGSNRINRHTISFATQGLANYLKKAFPDQKISVFIGYDTRLHSKEFAQISAQVLAGNEIGVYLNEEICPTPFTSFSCRYYGCQAAIMITASHNPAAYNGYKVFWQDGGQILPPHDQDILSEINHISHPSQVYFSPLDAPSIQIVGKEAKAAYLSCMKSLQLCDNENGNELHIIYTNLHGTGITLTPPLLKMWGFSNISYVEEQISLDGNFPTVSYPNPEEKEALDLGVKTLLEKNGDILIAQDPDADRMRAVILHEGTVVYLSGNQLACLLLNHILTYLKPLPTNGACIKTIVTSELFRKIAEAHHLKCFDVLTGFKYISQKIEEWEQSTEYSYIFGGEESYGTLFGTYSRDKDAVIAAALISEMAFQVKLQKKTLLDKLNELYTEYGFFTEYTHTFNFPETKEGREEMLHWMASLRKAPPMTDVIEFSDYFNKPGFPKSDVLEFRYLDGAIVIIRPSGTEPKIKIYAEANSYDLCKARALKIIADHQLNRPR